LLSQAQPARRPHPARGRRRGRPVPRQRSLRQDHGLHADRRRGSPRGVSTVTPRTGCGAFLSMHPAREQFDLVRRLEALGFDSVWSGDHLSFHHPLYESLTLLASYASITERIKLGSAVYLLALRSPAVAAKVTATLDVLSGGRLIFGVGVGGENPREFAAGGVPPRERRAPATPAPPRVPTPSP